MATFLAGLNAEDDADLRKLGRIRHFRRGATLFSAGDRSDSVLALVEGKVKLSHFDDFGTETVLSVTGPGDLLGELSALDGEPRSATGIALEPVVALMIGAAAFRDFIATHPPAAAAVVRAVTAKLRSTDRKVVALATQDTLARVAGQLLDLARRFGRRQGEAVDITLPLSQEELAGLVGASREAVVKALGSLRRQGVVATGRRRIQILDLAALEVLVR